MVVKRTLVIPLLVIALASCAALASVPGRSVPGAATPSGQTAGEGGSAQSGAGSEHGGLAAGGQAAQPGTGEGAQPGTGEGAQPGDEQGERPGDGLGAQPGDGPSGQSDAGQGDRPGSGRQVTLTFVGDIMLTRIPGEHIAKGEDPFADFAEILTGSDLTVGNLECVISTVGEAVPKWFNFRCDPETVPLLVRYFDAVGVANNHSGDYGPEAFAEQLQLLRSGGMPYFGGGMNLAEAHKPLIFERNGLKIALLAYNDVELPSYAAGPDSPGHAWIENEQVVADIRAARSQADIVVVYPHWGYDYAFWHDEYQAELARQAIEAGADLVVGSHPHVTQPVELYEGRLIAYSLGNYVFDDFMDVTPDLDEPSRTSWVLRVTIGDEGLIDWETLVARTDDRGFPQWMRDAASPCSEGAPEDGYLCTR